MNNQLITMDFGSEATISSFELLDQINLFRSRDVKKSKLIHKNLLAVIRDEFSEDDEGELQGLKIKQSFRIRELPNGGHKNEPYYELTISQAKQVLLRESKQVRRKVIEYLENFERAFANSMRRAMEPIIDRMDKIESNFVGLNSKLDQILLNQNNQSLPVTFKPLKSIAPVQYLRPQPINNAQCRVELNNLILDYSKLAKIHITAAWVEVYQRLENNYGFKVNEIESITTRESKIDKIERCGLIRPAFDIINALVAELRYVS
jgi:hypothetical protein|nr:MAG TPA: hypothetical protein [Caudoviricetes sp.]